MSDKHCLARLRNGKTCSYFGMKNGRCRLHGGLTPAKHTNFKGSVNALKSGFYAKEAIEERRKYARDIKHLLELRKRARDVKYLLELRKEYGLNADRHIDPERWESRRMQELAKTCKKRF
jgi:hypothetical protein